MINEIEGGIPVEKLRFALKKREPNTQEQNPQPYKTIFSGEELLNMGITEIPKLWAPFFPIKGVVGLTGSSDCGKSIFCRQMAMAIALGQKDFLGFPLNIRYGSALYVCTEDDYESIAALLSKQAGSIDANSLFNLHFLFESKDLMNQVDAFLGKTKVDLVVLDVWSDTYTGNPNNWVDVRQNLSSIKELASKHDCLIAIMHHTVKNSEKQAPDKAKLNGSQAIEAKLRCLLELRNGEVENERILYTLKANYMSREEKAEGHLLTLNSERLLLVNSGKKVAKSGATGESLGKKYDVDLWVTRMKAVRDEKGLSYDNARKDLVESFSEDEVPSKGWFMNQFKTVNSQSERGVTELND